MQEDNDKKQPQTVESSNDTLLKEDAALIPEGYVANARIIAATNEQGLTSIQLDGADHPFNTQIALSAQRYSTEDVGKKVACVRMAGSESIMIIGFLLQESASEQQSILDGLLDQSQSGRSKQQTDNTELANNVELDLENDGKAVSFDDLGVEPVNNNDNLKEEYPEHLVLKAGQTVTIKCGESSLTLAADGRIKLNGRNIFSRASQLQRISGGAIKLN